MIIRYHNLIVLETRMTIPVAIASGAQVVTPAAYMDHKRRRTSSILPAPAQGRRQGGGQGLGPHGPQIYIRNLNFD